jgi:hypothetical protein
MFVHFVSYGDDKYVKSRIRIIEEALQLDIFETCRVFTPETLEEDFKTRFKRLLDQPRGGGYWCWKPYIVLKTLQQIPDGHWLFYADAGCSLLQDRKGQIKQLISQMEEKGKKIFALKMSHHPEKYWTKGDLLLYFNIKNQANIIDSGQYIGGIFFVKNVKEIREMFEDMLWIMERNPELIDDTPSKEPNDKNFKDHRHDQSLFSIMRKINSEMVYEMEDNTFGGSSFCQATRIRS